MRVEKSDERDRMNSRLRAYGDICVCVNPCICVMFQAPKAFYAVMENAGCVM